MLQNSVEFNIELNSGHERPVNWRRARQEFSQERVNHDGELDGNKTKSKHDVRAIQHDDEIGPEVTFTICGIIRLHVGEILFTHVN